VQRLTTIKEPFAARLDMEIINAPSPVKTSRNNDNLYEEGAYLPSLSSLSFLLLLLPFDPRLILLPHRQPNKIHPLHPKPTHHPPPPQLPRM